MNERLINMTDEEVVKWLRRQVAIRKLLKKSCKDIAYDEEASKQILIYNCVDFLRLAKLLNEKLKITELSLDDPYTLNIKAYFMYHDLKIFSFSRTKEEFNE